ncbi:MAG TPA: chorismate mutase, partial [Candidatus Nanoarchaeia archaeon]|nr:chorismate mutase [Candidatus Nanoarchaeia archaeon]
EYAIEGLERYHATLGRFKHPDQHPMTGHLPKTRIKVETDESPISKVKINIKEDMLTFYTSALERLCKPGNNPNKYGETAYVDADLLSMMNERINLGRYVAESKLKSDPTLIKIQSDEEIVAKLRNQQREDEVVAKARKVAANYELDQDAVENFFRWMIDETVKVELSYVKQKR